MTKKLLFLALCAVVFGCSERLLAEPPTVINSTIEKPVDDLQLATPRPTKPTGKDIGLFSQFDSKVAISYPDWLTTDAVTTSVKLGPNTFDISQGVAFAFSSEQQARDVQPLSEDDVDGDGIPNQLDILIGGKKTILNHAPYGSPYRKLDFPNGDVPTTEGVCTDVIIRAVRNAGVDLQAELNRDIKRSPKSYRMVKRPDPNIDQRRVKTLLPFFKRKWKSLPTDFVGHESTWLPGDIVFMNTMGDARPDHVGIVSDKLGASGTPLIINNWTDGYSTDEIDIYPIVGATHRFRYPSKIVVTGVDSLLARHQLKVPNDSKQAIVVTGSSTAESFGVAQRFSRKRGGPWRPIGKSVSVRLGTNGLAAGIGFSKHRARRKKVEGDGRSPSGVFQLGKAFGKKAFKSKKYPFVRVQADDVWVDDPKSTDYNRWVQRNASKFASAESLTDYEYAVVVEHNYHDPKPGAGSAIFLHSWANERPTAGCTGFEKKTFLPWLKWLDDSKNPILIQVGDSFF